MAEKTLGGATRLIEGVASFQQHAFKTNESLFQRLSKGQAPLALFITCSDSRINPNLLTMTDPGELFILRNAGNIVPPDGTGPSGESATIEYALAQLKIRDIIICGHSRCGAMSGLLAPEAVKEMPAVREWLQYARGVFNEVEQRGAKLTADEKLDLAIELNVLCQIENTKTLPAVRKAIDAGRLRLHAWVYRFETGEVKAHDPDQKRFVPLQEAPRPRWTTEPEALPTGLGEVI